MGRRLPFVLACANAAFTTPAIWRAIARIPAAGATHPGYLAWVPVGYAVETLLLGMMIAAMVWPGVPIAAWRIRGAWMMAGALAAIAALGAMTIGPALFPGVAFVAVAALLATRRGGVSLHAAWWGLVGAGAQIGLMLLVIAFAFAAAPRG